MIIAPLLPGIHKIAVLRANALGDFIVALPALYSLRAAYPQAEIVYLGKKWHVDYLSQRPAPVDRVIEVPVSKGVNIHTALHDEVEEDPEQLARFFERMQAEHFDLAIQLHGGGRNSNPFLLKLGARITAGMKTPDAPVLDHWMHFEYWQHETFRLLECVALVGCTPTALEPEWKATAGDIDASCVVVPPGQNPIVILHPGASDARRRWAPEKFGQVGDSLAQAGSDVYITGTSDESEAVRQVVEAMRYPVVNLCGKLSLPALTGLLARAAEVISNDTGPRHLAAALGTPTVSIYWCGNMINAGPVTRSIHRPLISWNLICSVCAKNIIQENCDHSPSFVDDVRVEDVQREALDLLHIQQSMSHTRVL